MRIAIIGSGISGLSAAWRLAPHHRVTLFEADARPGGHTNSVDVTLDGITHPVDTGFLVYNERTYPKLIALFGELGIETAKSDMSFSVSVGPRRFEWCGSNLATLFAQPSNALKPSFWRMLADILRFNRQATALAVQGDAAAAALTEPLSAFLAREGYGDAFRDHYLLPMAAAIWSCPMSRMLEFPLGSFVRFFHNHGLLQVENRPQWFTVPGGARRYVRRMLERIDDFRPATPVRAVSRHAHADDGRVAVATDHGVEWFDEVVLACHSSQALELLADADRDERRILEAVPYQPNRAWLHTDERLMPRRRSAWAAWNYLSNGDPQAPAVSVTYWLNRLQPLPFRSPVFVSLNPLEEPAAGKVIASFDYEHPVFDAGSVDAQRALGQVQGRRGTWFAGAWTGYGFHEDGLKSGLAVAEAIEDRAAALAAGASTVAPLPTEAAEASGAPLAEAA
ncbi:FAD-dependent oxidoreductase [Burkholderiaceae bacterium FT117]|uniref:NAD(P)/FAD-dependent oxidoreductase n=1 Tax=Zeimonas sediminis TaxID=2944268 RepID=UPI002342C3D2|nr:FAD-dependent oxidoreductase [Zeimonas sediminis]MCM5570956.1 FAD-dependent oxidoreductase [Zeimonas sediminis]